MPQPTEYIEVEPYGDATLTVTTYPVSIERPDGTVAQGTRAYVELGPPAVVAARLAIGPDGSGTLTTRTPA